MKRARSPARNATAAATSSTSPRTGKGDVGGAAGHLAGLGVERERRGMSVDALDVDLAARPLELGQRVSARELDRAGGLDSNGKSESGAPDCSRSGLESVRNFIAPRPNHCSVFCFVRLEPNGSAVGGAGTQAT